MATVELIDVNKTFGSLRAVTNISLRINEGEFVALLGPSGCGKTTTLNMLAGFLQPDSGDIRFNGTRMNGVPPHRRDTGVVFQSYALFPHMTVFQNVAFGLEMRKVPKNEVASRVRRALDLVRLMQMEDRHPRQLSGGQQQRVALARALVIEPAVLLLDEPLSNLDAALREQMRFEIHDIQKRAGITTVFVTHDQGEAMAAADRLVIMDHGTIRQVGTARDIYETPVDPFVAGFIGQANLLPCVIDTITDGWASIRLADGGVASVRTDLGSQPGSRGLMMLRPEDAAVSATMPDSGNAIPGTLTRVTLLGGTFNLGVACADQTVSVLAPRGTSIPEVGEAVFVTWPRREGRLFADQ